MTIYYPGGIGVIAAVMTLVAIDVYTELVGVVIGEGIVIGVALVIAILVAIGWEFSPLPNNNGGMMAGDQGRYWGFKREDEN